MKQIDKFVKLINLQTKQINGFIFVMIIILNNFQIHKNIKI